MKNLVYLSKEANELRQKFQKTIINPFINENGDLKGYKRQIYLLLPKYDKRNSLCKGVSKETYLELYDYLFQNQSQRIFNNFCFTNSLHHVRTFENKDFTVCFSRVWHNGVSCYSGNHWAAQAAALFSGVKKYGFRYFSNDYNFRSHNYREMENANPLLKRIYSKILDRKLSDVIVSHEN
jgi:hypothetical protein